MPQERQKIEVGMGVRAEKPASGEEAKKAQKPKPEEVGGRYPRRNWVICPYCSANCEIIEETTMVQSYECWSCNGFFKY